MLAKLIAVCIWLFCFSAGAGLVIECHQIPTKLVGEAIRFAKQNHFGVSRQFDGKPYITHPVKVANIVKEYSQDPEMIAAAYLHDVLEDTPVTYKQLKEKFGKRVADLVQNLTSDEQEIKRLGKTEYLKQKMMAMPLDALLIKLADRLHNTSDFELASVRFINNYREQTAFILGTLMGREDLTHSHRDLIRRIHEAMWDGQMANIAKNFAADIYARTPGKLSRAEYFLYLSRVSKLLEKLHAPVEVRMAAYLKDVIEKSPEVTEAELREKFGPRVASLVSELTVNRSLRGGAKSREAYEAEHFAQMSKDAQMIKLAGRYDYLNQVYQDRAESEYGTYIAETREIVKVALEAKLEASQPHGYLIEKLESLLH